MQGRLADVVSILGSRTPHLKLWLLERKERGKAEVKVHSARSQGSQGLETVLGA